LVEVFKALAFVKLFHHTRILHGNPSTGVEGPINIDTSEWRKVFEGLKEIAAGSTVTVAWQELSPAAQNEKFLDP
jgi:predicted RNase H-like nuclease